MGSLQTAAPGRGRGTLTACPGPFPTQPKQAEVVQRGRRHPHELLRLVVTCGLHAALAGCGAANTLKVEDADNQRGRNVDFSVVASRWMEASDARASATAPRTSRRVPDPAGYAKAWHDFGFPGRPPPIDFGSKEALFVATLESTLCGVRPIVGTEITPQGVVILRSTRPGTYTCPRLEAKLYMYADIERETPYVVRVIVVPRGVARSKEVLFGWAESPVTAGVGTP